MTGTGTQADPYVVGTIDEFCTCTEQAGAYVELSNDIDCTNWIPENVQFYLKCNQIDGKGYSIKNIRVKKSDYSIGIMFKLAPENQNGIIKNLNWHDIYLNGVALFISNRRYGYSCTFQDCSFSVELYNGRFLWTDYTEPNFLRCSVFLNCWGQDSPFTFDSTVTPPIWDSCYIEIDGYVSHCIFGGRLVNSLLTGKVKLSDPYSSSTSYSAIWINNQGNESYANSVIDMEVECDSTWTISNDSSYDSGLLVNITRLQNYSFNGSTQVFIPCNDSQMTDITWLRTQGFDVGEESIGFSWHDFLMNGTDNRIHTLECSGGSPTFPFTIDGSSNTFSSTVSLNSEKRHCYTVPYNSWQWNTYTINIQSCHKYKMRITGNYDTGLTPYAMAWRNGDTWWSDMGTFEKIITAPDSTSTASFGIGTINYTGNSITGTFTITNFEFVKFSYWNVVNGKLVNSSLLAPQHFGAFYNTNLTTVSIPSSVKKIGPYSFAGTNLSTVSLAPDCKYFDTSFPSGCIITKSGTGSFNFIGNGQNVNSWSITGASGGVGTVCENIYPPINSDSFNYNYWGMNSSGGLYGEPSYSKASSWGGLCNAIYLDVGIYTFSIYIKSEVATNDVRLYIQGNSAYTPSYTPFADTTNQRTDCDVTTSYQRFTSTFAVTTAGYVYPRVEKGFDSGDNIYITCFQLERGPVATPYIPYGTTSGLHLPIAIVGVNKGKTDITGYSIPLNAPLGEGETITSSSSGLAISSYKGNNTFIVSTTVQPSSITLIPPIL